LSTPQKLEQISNRKILSIDLKCPPSGKAVKIWAYSPKSIGTLATVLFTAFLSCGGLSIVAPPELAIGSITNPAYPGQFQNQPVHEEFLGVLAHSLGFVLAAAALFVLVVAIVGIRRASFEDPR
jgi:hypothetical protein